MNLERFLSERADSWSELETLLSQAKGRVGNLQPEQILRLGELYRVAAADLALARRSFPHVSGTERLQGLVIAAHRLVYAKAERTETTADFLGRVLWQRIWQLGGCLTVSVGLLVGCVLLGVLWALFDPHSAAGLLPAGAHISVHSRGGFYGVSVPARGGLAVEIFTNNIQVSLMAVGGGFTFGVLTVYSLAYNGALLGVLGTLEWRGGGFDQFVRLVVPHGILEMSCISLAGAGGLTIARALIDPGRLTRSEALARVRPVLGASILGFMLFLVCAGLAEGFITPWDLPTPLALSVGLLLGGAFWTMVFWRGRPHRPTRAPAVPDVVPDVLPGAAASR